MKFFQVLGILPLLTTITAQSDPTAYKSNAEAAFNTLQTWYNSTSGLWNTCGWWNGANCLTAIASLSRIDPSIDATTIFATTYANAPPYNPGAVISKQSTPGRIQTFYTSHTEKSPPIINTRASTDPKAWLNSCYDDNAWWALAWISAYDLTNSAQYLSTAEGIFANLSSAWPTRCGNGGIPWCTNSNYINAIANELFLSTAAHLANRVSDTTAKSEYLSWAQKSWSWFQSVNLINSQGVIVDGLDASTCQGDPKDTVWSYNQGVILSGLVELSRADSTNSGGYISSAQQIAGAALTNLTDSNGILHDVCDTTANGCGADGTQFKGIFARGVLDLWRVDGDSRWKGFLEMNAQSIWGKDRDGNGGLGVDWAELRGTVDASTHSSALEAIIGAVAVG